MITEYDSKNALQFLKYSACYINSEIRGYILLLYKDVVYTMGLEIDGKPVGFMAVEKRSEEVHACQCIYITPKYRGKGLSEKLLMTAVNKSQSEGVKEFFCSYFENREWTEAARALFRKFDFELSGDTRNTYISERSDIRISIEAIKGKYKRYLDLKENKHTKKISELTPDEEEKIQTQLGKEIHCNFNPLLGMADEDASIILYKDDDPVAWMTFERKGSDALYISRLYVKDKYRNKGFFFPVICSAFDNTPEEIKRYFFYVNGNNKNMLGLLRAFNFSEIQQEKVIEMVKKL